MAFFFLFVDGLGIGNASDENPLQTGIFDALEFLYGDQKPVNGSIVGLKGNRLFKPIDACLDVEGLPQSGTGQVSLFTGTNASKLIGKHFGPYPHSATKKLLETKSLFRQMMENGLKPHFINAFPEIYFSYAQKRNRWSTTTLMTRFAGLTINGETEIRDQQALTAEIFQDVWKERLGIDIPSINPKEAAKRVLSKLQEYDLVLMEYYLTDKAGHAQDPKMAIDVLRRLNRFLEAFIEEKNEEITLVLTSDHGNVEDLSTKSHTTNPVPLMVFGKRAEYFSQAQSLTDITPAILESFRK